MADNLLKTACASQKMALQQGSLKDYNFSSREFMDLASQYCELINKQTDCKGLADQKMFGIVRMEMKVMPEMDIAFYAYNNPANTVTGKTIQSAAAYLCHENLAMQVKELCGTQSDSLVTELMLKAKDSGLGYLILDLPLKDIRPAVSQLGLAEAEYTAPLIIKISGAHPQTVSMQEFLKEQGAREVKFNQTLISDAVSKMQTSVNDMGVLLDKFFSFCSSRVSLKK